MKVIFRYLFACAFLLEVQSVFAQIETPIMGWSSWNTYRVNISDSLIKRQADAMVDQGLKGAGYTYINVDDGFFGYRDEQGNLCTHPKRFPNGMKAVADYIHSKGLKAGIYSDAGGNTCGSLWDKDMNGVGVGLYGHERQDADLFFNQWGFDFIKIDYCGAGQQLELDEQKRYTEIVKAIRETAKKNVSVNICRWAFPGTWAKDLARSWRISPDIAPDWGSVRAIINKNLYLSAYAGEGHYNDMDMLEIGRGLKQEEEEVHFGMWCIMSSPLLIGCDLTTIPESSLNLLKNKELIALNQDPLGLQAYVVQHEGAGYVLVKDIEQKRGKVRAVALYNPSDEVCAFSVPLSLLELGGKVAVRDLVKQRDEKKIRDSLCYDVPPHSVKILRLKAEERLEPRHYEAEWAYLPCFNDLAKRSRGVAYKPYGKASGGMIVSNLGGKAANYAEWKEVYSENGGEYRMRIAYVPAQGNAREVKDRRLEVEINGQKTCITELESDPAKGVCHVTLPIDLRQGYNSVKIGSAYTWTPDIDCFTLERPVKNKKN
ncbi:alpha-galactosidase D [Parabacteroides johnsonii]|jgi:hypothetical protein|uniref:alpha-galactosidase D n=1 Tax=Parabacteroides johnsonii TaxID=387661 RepID=UPI001C8C75C4|nr:alpha-galactosidase [Parabacteroides johnsonii]MBX9111743.1 alpha-galactosidase [Parabacteroides johnsonii]